MVHRLTALNRAVGAAIDRQPSLPSMDCTDLVWSPPQPAAMRADATEVGENTTIALPDGTTITFVDATTAQLQGHLFSS
jgi:hypothetical protein